jgi:thioredoxin 1
MIITVNESTFPSAIPSSNPTVFIFSAPWCGPCRSLKPTILKLESNPAFSNIGFYEVNCDESREIAAHWHISSIPTLVFWDGTKETGRLIGVPSEVKITDELSKI